MQAFGNYRGAAPTQTVTDRDFTGQPQNRAVGLLYYQARYYVPGIGRFASADTLVPDPTNPQQYNRYSYVLNNALRYTDPTGHCVFGLPCPAAIQDVVDTASDFIGGVILQVAHDNTLAPNVRNSLAASPNESNATLAGRIFGGLITAAQGLAEGFAGVNVAAGGIVACGTGVFCVASPAAVTAGAALTAHGTLVATNSLKGLLENNSILLSTVKGPGGSQGRDFQRLSQGEKDILVEAGYHPHDLKPQKGGSRFDIFKDKNGDLYVMPKDGRGAGEPLGLNINDLWE